MIVYYPKNSVILRRDTISASYEQTILSVNPNTVLYMDTGSGINAISASTIYITASHALSASAISVGDIGIGGMELFTTGGYWSVPTGTKKVRVIAIGGGGGGGNSGGGANHFGQHGAYCEGVVSVDGLSQVYVSVGGGGAGFLSSADGVAGGSSSFLTIVGTAGIGWRAESIPFSYAATGSGGTIVHHPYNPSGSFYGMGGNSGLYGESGSVTIYY